MVQTPQLISQLTFCRPAAKAWHFSSASSSVSQNPELKRNCPTYLGLIVYNKRITKTTADRVK